MDKEQFYKEFFRYLECGSCADLEFCQKQLEPACKTGLVIYRKLKMEDLEKENEQLKKQCQECKHLNKKTELNIKNKLMNEIAQLKQQLAESDEYRELLLEEKAGYLDLISGYADKCKKLEQQLAEKEKERHEEWLTGKEWKWECDRLKREQNQTAIAELEKVQKYIVEEAKPVIGYPYLKNSVMILNFVCDQIKSLKGEK